MIVSRTVVSPAGESIDILNDEVWVKRTGDEIRSLRQWRGPKGGKALVIAELWLGGKIENGSGRATKVLHDSMRARFPSETLSGPTSFAHLMTSPINVPAFERVTNGKRTYSLRLAALPETWYRKLQEDLKTWNLERKSPPQSIDVSDDQEDKPESSPASDELTGESMNGNVPEPIALDEFDDMIREIELDAPTVYDISPPLELQVASQVAMSLLTTVVEIITAGSSEGIDAKVRQLQGDVNDISTKLAARLAENDQLRRQMRQAGDDIIALRTERDGLRSRLKATEANLTAALKGDAVQAINGEIQRRVDSIMRTTPTKKGPDNG